MLFHTLLLLAFKIAESFQWINIFLIINMEDISSHIPVLIKLLIEYEILKLLRRLDLLCSEILMF